MFCVVPLLGALAVWMTARLGARVHSHLAGAVSAVLLATSPAFLYQVVQPVSDVPAAAWWTMALAFAVLESAGAALVAGLAASMAILTRPKSRSARRRDRLIFRVARPLCQIAGRPARRARARGDVLGRGAARLSCPRRCQPAPVWIAAEVRLRGARQSVRGRISHPTWSAIRDGSSRRRRRSSSSRSSRRRSRGCATAACGLVLIAFTPPCCCPMSSTCRGAGGVVIPAISSPCVSCHARTRRGVDPPCDPERSRADRRGGAQYRVCGASDLAGARGGQARCVRHQVCRAPVCGCRP